MTQEDKELLLKDLCARLPYDIKVRRYVYTTPVDSIQSVELFDPEWLKELYSEEAEFKPYLFPLSSMTKKQRYELYDLIHNLNVLAIKGEIEDWIVSSSEIDWYNKNHFDYKGLIEKGLAIDATGLNIY